MSERKGTSIWDQISIAGIRWAEEFAPDEPKFVAELEALEDKRDFYSVAYHLYRLGPQYSPDFFWSALSRTDLPEPKSMARHLRNLFLLPGHLRDENPPEGELQHRVDSEMRALGLKSMPIRIIRDSLEEREMSPVPSQSRSLKWPAAKWDIKGFHEWEAVKERKFSPIFEIGLYLDQTGNQQAMGAIARGIIEAALLPEKLILDVPPSLLMSLEADIDRCFQWLTINEAISLDLHPYGNPYLRRLEMLTSGVIPVGPRGREVKKGMFREKIATEYVIYVPTKKEASVDLKP